MFRNYFRAAFRSLFKNKAYSAINIAGSVIGMVAFILVILYVSYELSFDKFYKNSDNIYRVYIEHKKEGHFAPGDAQTYNQTGPTLKKTFSEIRDYVRLYRLNKAILEYNGKTFEVANGHLTDPSYFNIFDCPLVAGDGSSVLNKPNTIVLSESISKKIFGRSNSIGENITAYSGNRKTTLTITGILKDIPENTHMKTNFLVSFQTINNWQVTRPVELNWNNNNYFTYILVNKNTNTDDLRKKIAGLDFPQKDHSRHNIESLASIHLYSDKPYEAETNGSAVRVKFLLIIAIIIIILSWLNYMNLTTSKSMERLKEVGVRKVSGARKKQLILQFMSESLLLNLIAIFIAAGIVFIAIPYMNAFTGKNLILGLSWNKSLLLLIGIPLLGILVSGFYPSLVLSGFKPAVILKGKMPVSPQHNLRKGFVIVQFMVTIVLLIGTFTVIRQIKFLGNHPLGVNLSKIIAIKGELTDERSARINNLKTLKEEIKKMASAERVATVETFPGEGYDDINTYMGITYPDGTSESQTVWYNYRIDEDYLSLMEIKLLAGNQFSVRNNNSQKVIMNEKAAKQMGFVDPEEAVNRKIRLGGNECLIVGIMKDYHHFGLKNEIEPFILTYSDISETVLVKLKSEAISASVIENSIKQLKEKWQQVFPKSNFSYTFVDDKFASLYKEERMFSKVFMLFTILAIIIASLGLIGMAYYRSLLRTKEIGVRKVTGARITEILAMLSGDFIILVTIAFIFACPVAWYVMSKWLQNFTYKTNLSWWIFAIAGAIAMTITIVVVSWQSWRAATKNPVEALRYE